jgi:UDP-N-acetylmuramoyl-tripeptide--D-alanyl-D-alanine ligase
MIEGRLSEVATAVGGRLIGDDVAFCGAGTDTRTLAPGSLFFALKGERYDAHDMLDGALAAGAAGLVVSRDVATDAPRVVVDDTRVALGALAHAWRWRFDIPVLAITGSNGKTTTKEMLASILRTQGPTLATAGNLNNDIGVPLTLFQLGAEHRHAVIEMGANRPNDIADLVAIALPTVALVTMCGPAHLEGFGDIAGVATAKGKIYTRLLADGVAVINVDDVYAAQWRATAGNVRVLTFGLGADAAVSARDIEHDAIGAGSRFTLCIAGEERRVRLPFDGLHNVRNALAATAAAHAVGVPVDAIVSGLEAASRVKGRLNIKRSRGGMQLIDDSYNANPASVAAAIALLGRQPNARWLVFGDMGELGSGAEDAHRQVGLDARAARIDRLFGIGAHARAAVDAFGDGSTWYPDADTALPALLALDGADATVLIKASRFMQLDRLVDALLEPDAPPAAAGERTTPC